MGAGGSVVYAGFSRHVITYGGAVLFEAFLYGTYTMLFFISVYVLLWCSPSRQWLLLIASIVMYAIATADIIYTILLLLDTFLGKTAPQFWSLYPKYSLLVTNTFVAHALLLYRCVAVWGPNRWLIGLGSFGLIVVTVVGYTLEGTSVQLIAREWIWLSLTLVLNLTLTVLIAGRVLYIAKKNSKFLPEALKRRYIITTAILIECGALYTLYLSLSLGFQKHPDSNTVLDCSAVQVVGIVPTLIVVQVGLGRSASYDYSKEEPTQFPAARRRRRSQDYFLAQPPPSATLNRSQSRYRDEYHYLYPLPHREQYYSA